MSGAASFANGAGAVLVGATGLVGREILRLLLDDPAYARVRVLARRAVSVSHPKLEERIVDFDAPETWSELVEGAVVFSALGTTLKVAGTKEAQHRVDYGYQFETARAAAKHGVSCFVLVSAYGASPNARVFYSRMKGELERDVSALGIARTRILRPGLLSGDRQERRRGEELALALLRPIAAILPAAVRPISVSTVARSAVRAAVDPKLGVIRYEPSDLFRLGR
jgi:uncharacterized protein YbjT (DUF2867 family)